jgi:hypothetical protein
MAESYFYIGERTGQSLDVDILEEAERYFRGVKWARQIYKMN